MKKLIFLLLFVNSIAFAQFQKHATFSFESPKNAKIGDVVEIKFKAKIDPTWHLYSSQLKVEGPQPTEFTYTKSDDYTLVGKPKPVGFHDFYEEVWGGNTSVAEGAASFIQQIKILKENPTITGEINGQTCQSDGMCVPLTLPFKFDIKTIKAPLNTPTAQLDTPKTTITPSVVPAAVTPPTATISAVQNTPNTTASNPLQDPCSNLWGFLLTCFLGGLAAIFMPCIYPIMPMTVSFFTKQENGRSKALLYGLSIVVIYTVLGVLVSRLGGAQAANFISTHWLPNLIFFVVFVAFGLSFLGLFEIVLPSKFVNDVDRKADKGGLMGIFFMALTLVVVSFSCTAPIAGTLLILASQGDIWCPILGMIAFSLPFAAVFTLLAMFPNWLKSLPKSGGWLNEFKVVFGILEFALALKFLSNIDLAYHWNTLDREIFLAIWIVLFTILGFYVMGKIRMEKDSEIKGLTIPRFLIATAVFSFVMDMIPGMFGAPLRGLSGWLPPEQTQDFYLSNNASTEGSTVSQKSSNRKPHLPHGLKGHFSYEEAVAAAKAANKPIFIDFTGFNCANCRKMEANVWPEPEVLSRLRDNFVIASLYVDDKTELPANQRYISTFDKKEKTTIGDKNIDLEITKFNSNAQPWYCIVSPDGTLLAPPTGYTSTEEFIKFLDAGAIPKK